MFWSFLFLILLILSNHGYSEEPRDGIKLTNLSIENNKGLISIKLCCENKSDSIAKLKVVFEGLKTGRSGVMKTNQSQDFQIKPSENLCILRNAFSVHEDDKYKFKILIMKDSEIIYNREINSEDFS